MIFRVLLSALLMISLNASAAEWDQSLSKKLNIRTRNGIIRNASTAGQTMALGGLNLVFNYFLLPEISLGAGYNIDIDFSDLSVPVSGLDLITRFYFMNHGTRTVTDYSGGTAVRHDAIAYYAGASLGQRNIFKGSRFVEAAQETSAANSPAAAATGSFMEIGVSLGCDLRISRRFELNAEGNATALTFASSDTNTRLKGYLLLLGVNYLF